MPVMSVDLARARLRGIYALVAGLLLLIGIPMLEGVMLAPLGYASASAAAIDHGDFGPLLLWVGQNTSSYVLFHIVELAAFILLVPLPVGVRSVTCDTARLSARLWAWVGQAGFVLYALAILINLIGATQAGAQYLAATGTRAREEIVASYLNGFVLQNLLGAILGGGLVAIWLLFLAARALRGAKILRWIALCGTVPALVLAATTLQYMEAPARIGSPLSPLALPLLALWLMLCGAALARWAPRQSDTKVDAA